MTRIKYFIVSVIIATSQFAIGQDFQTLVDDIMNPVVESNQWAGVVLFEREGEIKALKAYGFSDVEKEIPNTLETKFPLGTAGQCFSAVAILKLEEKGLLSVNDPVSKFITELPYGDQITIHNLLTGSAGIPAFKSFLNEEEFDKLMYSSISELELLKIMSSQELEYKPGELLEENVFPYPLMKANWPELVGNILLGMIIEKVSSENYGEFIFKNIFQPLGMDNSGFFKEGIEVGNMSLGYESVDNSLVKTERMKFLNFTGATSLYSTPSDMLKFYKSLHNEKLLSKNSIEKMTKPYSGDENRHRFAYAMAYVGDGKFGRRILYDSNEGNGYYVSLIHHYDEDITLIRLGNVGTLSPRQRPGYENYKPQPSGQWTQQLVRLIRRPEGYSAASELKKELDASIKTDVKAFVNNLRTDSKYYFLEQEFNNLGYYYVSQNELKLAISVFEINIDLYPESANVYDSYAEALYELGKMEDAIKNYKKSLKQNPQNKNAISMIEKIEKELSE